jgi:hypothetical protein
LIIEEKEVDRLVGLLDEAIEAVAKECRQAE